MRRKVLTRAASHFFSSLKPTDNAVADRHRATRFATGMALAAGLLFSVPALYASGPKLWPTFSRPSTIVNVNLVGAGQLGNNFMAEATLQGAYNQLQKRTRLYVSTAADDPYWLLHAVPAGITVSNFPFTTSDPNGALKALLAAYGPWIKGYYICDPYPAPESCNMAMTLAAINDAMVVNPDNLAVMSAYSVPLMPNGDLRTYTWVGADASLINNATINKVDNPSGGDGTSGWSANGGTVSATTYNDAPALEWTRPADAPNDAWAKFDPAITASGSTRPYIFSVQVAGSGTVFLDAYNGAADVQSAPVTLTSNYQTLQLEVPIPLSGNTSNHAIQIQVRAHSQSNALSVYFINAAAVGNRVAIDTYQFNNLISSTNGTILAQDFPNSYNLRDYQVAAKMFTFDLSQDNADEKTLYGKIIDYTPHNTPMMGYIDDENNDVPFLSGSGEGHFLNASDDYNNGSVWASLPQPRSLWQPAPAAISTTNGTVYVALAASDGDNASIIQHQNVQRWTDGKFLGAVPMAWTMPPGMIQNSPGIISNFYQFLPQSDEIMAGPSGVGYAQGTTGGDVTPFADLTRQFMNLDSMSTVTNWFDAADESNVAAFADVTGVPHVVWRTAYPYTLEGRTVIDGQVIGYNAMPDAQISAIESYVSDHWSSGAPLFVEALYDDLTLSQDDALYVAQQLQLHGGHPYVFMTPSEMALTEKAAGSVSANPQAVAGSTLTAAYPNNVIWNANGQEPGASVTSSSWALGGTGHDEELLANQDFNGSAYEALSVPGNAGVNCYAYEYLGKNVVVGRYYRFSVSVAGSGTAFMTVYDGTANHKSAPIQLSSAFQTISMIVEMQSATKGQIQVGVAPSSSAQVIYFSASTSTNPGWYYSAPGSSSTTASFGAATFNGSQAFSFSVPASEGSDQAMNFYPDSLVPGATYNASVDLAGTPGATALLDFNNGGSDSKSSLVTLSSNWQTVNVSGTISGSGTPMFEVQVPTQGANTTVYFRNASLVESGSGGTIDFYTGLESGQPQLSWTDTVDSASPGGGESGVDRAILQSSTAVTNGGSDSIHYGGTASGGSDGFQHGGTQPNMERLPSAQSWRQPSRPSSTHAYMKAFSNSTMLSSTSRLSYWIYPETPLGQEAGASSMTGQNSICVAVDIVFTDGTALRNLPITDQYGNMLNPADECNHLEPDQWNYVTADLGRLSGKMVERIDVDYDQPGGRGNYGGYVDDVRLTH